ncbi:MAG: hypothetical protein KC731_00700 [Myxococcales bacterium]|nr:hypothetical protein [Myxococcales bacterium]
MPSTPAAKATHDHDHPHHERAAATAGVAHGMLAIPAAAADGPKREVLVLVDRPELKLATIILREGTVLPEHSAPVPVTIQLLEGAGTARFGDNEERMHASKLLLLEADEAHTIVPDAGTTTVLLVHYLRAVQATGKAASDPHGQ